MQKFAESNYQLRMDKARLNELGMLQDMKSQQLSQQLEYALSDNVDLEATISKLREDIQQLSLQLEDAVSTKAATIASSADLKASVASSRQDINQFEVMLTKELLMFVDSNYCLGMEEANLDELGMPKDLKLQHLLRQLSQEVPAALSENVATVVCDKMVHEFQQGEEKTRQEIESTMAAVTTEFLGVQTQLEDGLKQLGVLITDLREQLAISKKEHADFQARNCLE